MSKERGLRVRDFGGGSDNEVPGVAWLASALEKVRMVGDRRRPEEALIERGQRERRT